MELYKVVPPSSLIRMVQEFLQRNNINSNIKIIVYIYILFFFLQEEVMNKKQLVFMLIFLCDSDFNLTWSEVV